MRHNSKIGPRALFVCLLAILATNSAPVTAQTSDEFFDLVNLALPPEISDAATNADLLRKWLNPTVVKPQLSNAFDPRKAYLAVDPRSRLSPDARCFREKEPGNDPNAFNESCIYFQGETTGELPAVQLRFNLFRGKFVYLNRGRSFDFARSPENKVPLDAARATAQQLAVAFGVPLSELDLSHIDVRQLTAAAVPVTVPSTGSAAAVQQTIKAAEVQVRIPRKVGDLPVFDSQFFAAMGDGPGQTCRRASTWSMARLCTVARAGRKLGIRTRNAGNAHRGSPARSHSTRHAAAARAGSSDTETIWNARVCGVCACGSDECMFRYQRRKRLSARTGQSWWVRNPAARPRTSIRPRPGSVCGSANAEQTDHTTAAIHGR